jgi:nitrogen regulatory protein PII
MKMIIAFVQPFMAKRVIEALNGLECLSGATLTEVRGFGRGRARGASGVTKEEIVGSTPNLRVEAMVSDGAVDQVVCAIRDATHTGNRGDGRVCVVPLERALRIATGEEGESAV